MCSAGRLEVHVVNPRLSERIAEVLYARTFYGARGQKQQPNLLVEIRRIRKSAAAAGLRVKRPTSAATAAESTQVGKLVEVLQAGREGLHAPHGQAGHGTVFAARSDAVVLLDHRNQIGEHHLGEG